MWPIHRRWPRSIGPYGGAASVHTAPVISLRQGSNELDSSCSRERSSPVMLSAAKHLAADCDRPFASLRVTGCDESTCQGLFFTIEPCLRKIFRNYLHRLPLLWSCSQGSSIARSEEIDYHVQT